MPHSRRYLLQASYEFFRRRVFFRKKTLRDWRRLLAMTCPRLRAKENIPSSVIICKSIASKYIPSLILIQAEIILNVSTKQIPSAARNKLNFVLARSYRSSTMNFKCRDFRMDTPPLQRISKFYLRFFFSFLGNLARCVEISPSFYSRANSRNSRELK